MLAHPPRQVDYNVAADYQAGLSRLEQELRDVSDHNGLPLGLPCLPCLPSLATSR